jgi:hypothetical protein
VPPRRDRATVIPGRREAASPESITTAWNYRFRARATDLGFTRDRRSTEPKSAKADLGGAPRNDSDDEVTLLEDDQIGAAEG